MFLDVLIKKNDGKILIDIYFQLADTRRCLLFSSSHPIHCKKNIPFTLARIIFTIVENKQKRLGHLSELNESLKKIWLPRQDNGKKWYQESPRASSNLRNPKKNKQIKFYQLFLHLIQITHLYTRQSRILFKSFREKAFQDLKASNL